MKVVARLIFWVTVLASLTVHAQLSGFGLEVVPANETCKGNGTLTFTVTNTTPGATFLYLVYLQPDMGNPIKSTTDNSVSGLSAGVYTVRAIQTLGADSNQAEQDATIKNTISDLNFTVSSATQDCKGEGGLITITTTSGNASQYEILSPIARPPQASNVFTGLPAETYNIGVIDACGQEKVLTYTLTLNPSAPVISNPIFADILTGSCDTITITNNISFPEGTVITYPLTVVYTIHPPDGAADIIVKKVYADGAPNFLEFSNTFTNVNGDTYNYDITVTNGCGLTYGPQGMSVNPEMSVTATPVLIPCGKYYLKLHVQHFMPPFSIDFLSAPKGFNPSDYNATPPGKFKDPSVDYGGPGQPMPEGSYQVRVTDACGRTKDIKFAIIDEIVEPVKNAVNNGCFSDLGKITISVPGRAIVSAQITAAPDKPVPRDASSFINAAGTLVITNTPVGEYTVKITDICGQNYVVMIVVPDFVEKDFVATPIADCNTGIGAVKLVSGNSKLGSVKITAAPAAFTEKLPFDASLFIDDKGVLYMDNLPEGNYTFSGTDFCGISRTLPVVITGYQPSGGVSFTFEPNCNSFNILMSDADTSSASPAYWLQKENPDVPGQWMHPATGAVYAEGTMPDSTNSIALENNAENPNNEYFGTFRIVKTFLSVGRGTSSKLCFSILDNPFNYQFGVTVNDVYNLSCNDRPNDVYVDATGLAPLRYFITAKDGVDITPIDNGNSTIFSGLEPGVYKFVVQDACGQQNPLIKDISLLPNLVTAGKPTDMIVCVNPGEQPLFRSFDLTAKNAEILGNQSPDNYVITYYLNRADADKGVNALEKPEDYTNISNPQTIYARIMHNYIGVCHTIVDFTIRVAASPDIEAEQQAFICTDAGFKMLTAPAGYDTYAWSTGQATQSVTVTQPGTYTVTVGNIYGSAPSCTATATIMVTASGPPGNFVIDAEDWTEDNNSIAIKVSGDGAYEYSLDDTIYQDDPVFTGLEPGLYTVYVRDKGGCGTTSKKVALLNYPKFFTPNGDGSHETWYIKFSKYEPAMLVYIYDRYGMLITSFGPGSAGWDGTFNGRPLPSTDYWFVVNRQDGRIFKGHFSLIR